MSKEKLTLIDIFRGNKSELISRLDYNTRSTLRDELRIIDADNKKSTDLSTIQLYRKARVAKKIGIPLHSKEALYLDFNNYAFIKDEFGIPWLVTHNQLAAIERMVRNKNTKASKAHKIKVKCCIKEASAFIPNISMDVTCLSKVGEGKQYTTRIKAMKQSELWVNLFVTREWLTLPIHFTIKNIPHIVTDVTDRFTSGEYTAYKCTMVKIATIPDNYNVYDLVYLKKNNFIKEDVKWVARSATVEATSSTKEGAIKNLKKRISEEVSKRIS